MPWKEVSVVSLRKEFVMLASQPGANRRELCRRFGISPTTAYKWLRRCQHAGEEGLLDCSRKPHHSPKQTSTIVEDLVLSVRDAFPVWGARKIKAKLEAMGHSHLPSTSTMTEILRRHNRLNPEESVKHTAWKRFEHEAPNRLWQMDFKGHFPLEKGRCHPLTILDDHSRYALCLEACQNEQGQTVEKVLTEVFRRYGLPQRMTMDNGSPWGSDSEHSYTPLTVWLIRLGIGVSHSRPYHPQTQGKDERFHRTLKAEVLANRLFRNTQVCQQEFDEWRVFYNCERPHQALQMAVPASRYQPSPWTFPEELPPIEYGADDIVRKVQQGGVFSYKGRNFKVSKAFSGQPVGLRPTTLDGVYHIYFCQQKVREISLNWVS